MLYEEYRGRARELNEVAQNYDAIVVGTSDAIHNELQRDQVLKLHRLGKPVVVIGLRSPYVLAAFPQIDCFLTAYEYSLPALVAAMEVVFGHSRPEGRLPVSLPGICSRGNGL
jgi:beta-N-acetylhexosaminidase